MMLRTRTVVAALAAGLTLGCATGRFDRLTGRDAPPPDRLVYELHGPAAAPALAAFAAPPPAEAVRLASHESADAAPATESAASGPEPTFVRLTVECDPTGRRARAVAACFPTPPPPPPASGSPLPGASRHPTRRRPGSARVAASSRNAAPSDRETVAYALDVSPAEFDLLTQELRGAGLFGGQERPEGGAWVTAGRGDAAVRKQWTPEPRLDDLLERAVRDGRRIDSAGK